MFKFNKKIILSSVILTLSAFSSDYYAIIGNNNIIVEIKYDEFGFDASGTHKDTGTEYAPSGYNQNGFDEQGLGIEDCAEYDGGGQYTRKITDSRYSYIDWDNAQVMTNTGNSYFTYIDLKTMHYYYVGELKSTGSTYANYEVCRKEVTRAHVENLILHPNKTIEGDFKNSHWW